MVAEGKRNPPLLKNGRATSSPRFQLGDRVLVEPSKSEGIIVVCATVRLRMTYSVAESIFAISHPT